MAEECRPFDLYETEEGWFYQAVGTKENPERIEAVEIIKALDKIANDVKNGKNKINGVQISYGKIAGDLNIKDATKLEIFEEGYDEYIWLPNIILDFEHTIFEGEVSFAKAWFEGPVAFTCDRFVEEVDFEITHFEGVNFGCALFEKKVSFLGARFGVATSTRTVIPVVFIGAQFREEVVFAHAHSERKVWFNNAQFIGTADFIDAQFQLPAGFENVKYWSDSPRVTVSCLLRNLKIFRRFLLPQNSPEGTPQKPTQFYLNGRNIDEVTNPHFKRYVEDQQFLRSFQENHPAVYWLWKITSNCGRSLSFGGFGH